MNMQVPSSAPGADADEETLRSLHRLLFEVRPVSTPLLRLRPTPRSPPTPPAGLLLAQTHVKDGNLHCQLCGRDFPIKNGIPNMLLHDDEV